MEDLKAASEMLIKAMKIRQKYMKVSKQDFPSFVDRYYSYLNDDQDLIFYKGFLVLMMDIQLLNPQAMSIKKLTY